MFHTPAHKQTSRRPVLVSVNDFLAAIPLPPKTLPPVHLFQVTQTKPGRFWVDCLDCDLPNTSTGPFETFEAAQAVADKKNLGDRRCAA